MITFGSINFLVVLSFLDQKLLTFCNLSRGVIFHIKCIIISVSQAKIKLTSYSLRMDLSSFFVILCHAKVLYQINKFINFNYRLCSLLHILMYVYSYPVSLFSSCFSQARKQIPLFFDHLLFSRGIRIVSKKSNTESTLKT